MPLWYPRNFPPVKIHPQVRGLEDGCIVPVGASGGGAAYPRLPLSFADKLDEILDDELDGGLSNAWVKSVWTSVDGTVVGPTINNKGAPVTGHHSPWDDSDGNEITATRTGGADSLRTTTSVDGVSGDDIVMGILCRIRADATDTMMSTQSLAKGVFWYTLAGNPHLIIGHVAGNATVEKAIVHAPGLGYWAWHVIRAEAGGSVSWRLNGETGAADSVTPAGLIGEGAGLGIGGTPAGGSRCALDVAAACFLVGSGLAAWWSDATDSRIARRLFGLRRDDGEVETFARASAGSTHGADGRRHLVTVNVPRGAGQNGGMNFEPASSVNKARSCDSGQWTATGGMALSDVSDSAALISAGVEAMRPTETVLQAVNATGTTQYLYCGDVTGSTNRHSACALIRTSVGTGPQLGIYDPATTQFRSSGYVADDNYEITRAPGLIPHTASQQVALQILNGSTVLIAAAHLNEGYSLPQSAPIPIIATGAGYTGAAESVATPVTITTPGTKRNIEDREVTPRELWLVAGQSNARGNAAIAALHAAYTLPDADVRSYLYSPDEAYESAAVEALTSGGTYLGPWIPFALDLADMHRLVSVGAVVEGSTSLAVDWAPGGTLSNKLIAVNNLLGSDSGYPAKNRGLIWIQGEQDATDAVQAAAYETNLTTWIAAMRSAISSSLHIYIVQLSDRCGLAQKATVRAAQAAVVAADAQTTLVDIDDLHLSNDGVHWSAGTILDVGHRMALTAAEATL